MEQLFSNSSTYSLTIPVSLSPLCADVAMEKTFRLYPSLSAEKNHYSHIIYEPSIQIPTCTASLCDVSFC